MNAAVERIWYPDGPESFGQKLARSPLAIASLGFRAAVGARNLLFERGILAQRRIDGAQVVSVGNLTVGGAGKTPVAIFLAQRFRALGRKVAVLSRGYGRRSRREFAFDAENAPPPEEAGDEPVLIARKCPGVRIYVGADRSSMAARARGEGAEVLVLDDGMQHRRLARDAEVLVVDEAVGFGNGAMLPRGPLREPLAQIRRASLLWVRASEEPVPGLPLFAGPIVRAVHAPSALLAPDGVEHPPALLRGRRVHALCGIARPGRFTQTLQSLGAIVTGVSAFPDHHFYAAAELVVVGERARVEGAFLVTTEKDRVRLPGGFQAWVLLLGVTIESGEEHLDRLLAQPARTG
jgi:tetraacyldisaccharide 4'-kinase